MKSRPRSVEREVAAHLSQLFSDIGKSPVERIPVLGRTGPDISHNDVKLIVDVKSRLEVPANRLVFDAGSAFQSVDRLFGFRLEDLNHLDKLAPIYMRNALSIVVARWYYHMREWVEDHEPDGITCLILHRPRMPIGHSTVIISINDRSLLCQRMHKQP